MRALLFSTVLSMIAALPAMAQNEKIRCRASTTPQAGKTMSASWMTEITDGRAEGDPQRGFSISYDALNFQATAPLVAKSARMSSSWSEGRPTTASSASASSGGASLSLELGAPEGARITPRMTLRFWQGNAVLAEITKTATIRDLSSRDNLAPVSLRISVPDAVATASGAVMVEVLASTDMRRIATANFELSGFTATPWHRSQRDMGVRINADTRTIASVPSSCERESLGARTASGTTLRIDSPIVCKRTGYLGGDNFSNTVRWTPNPGRAATRTQTIIAEADATSRSGDMLYHAQRGRTIDGSGLRDWLKMAFYSDNPEVDPKIRFLIGRREVATVIADLGRIETTAERKAREGYTAGIGFVLRATIPATVLSANQPFSVQVRKKSGGQLASADFAAVVDPGEWARANEPESPYLEDGRTPKTRVTQCS